MEPENNRNYDQENLNNRILIVDDNPEIHKDFKKILGSVNLEDSELDNLERELFKSKTKEMRGKWGEFRASTYV